jgi:hypothetical protein
MTAFYRAHFGNAVSPPVRVPIGVINRANALAPETCHSLALLTLPEGTRVELDQYPRCTMQRPGRPGHLPPGMALVSFRIGQLPDLPLLTRPCCAGLPPLAASRSACVRGAAGELIELFELG